MIAQILEKIGEIAEQKLDTLLLKTEARLNPPLQKAEALEIETKLGISLPDDFRDFVTSAGNGGFGPGLGLTPFGPESVIDTRIPKQGNRAIDVAGQFPYTSDWNYEPLRQSMEEGRSDADEQSEYYFSVDRIQGAIRIGDGGCGAINLLVLSGSERGNIWYDFRGTFGGICPATRSQKEDARLSFTEWYDAWLSEILLKLPFEERHII